MNRKPGYGAQLRANLEPTKGVGRLRQQDGGHGSRNPLRRGESGSPRAGRGTDWERSFRRSSPGVEQSTQNWYGQGESDCLIKTKHCDGPCGCSRNVISAQCSECQSEEIQPSAGKRRE
jgi:hypothetical protein